MSLTCQDIMLKEQVILSPTDNLSKAFRLIRKYGMCFLPVVGEDGTYLGVFTSPTLIRLLLPKALTIDLDGRENLEVSNLEFYTVAEKDFHNSLDDIKNEMVQNHLADSKNIPVTAPDTPAMEGVLLLHKYKRHVVLVEPETQYFVGVLTINSVLEHVFDEDHVL